MWKIPLDAREVLTLSIDDITALAANGSRDIEFPAWDDVGTAPPCEALYKDIARKPTFAETFKIEPTQNLFPTGKSGMAMWRKRLFAFMLRNAPTPTDYFGLPPNRVVELGAQVEI